MMEPTPEPISDLLAIKSDPDLAALEARMATTEDLARLRGDTEKGFRGLDQRIDNVARETFKTNRRLGEVERSLQAEKRSGSIG